MLKTILHGAGIFIYPLTLAWLASLFVIVERFFIFSKNCPIPTFSDRSVDRLLSGPRTGQRTILQRVVRFCRDIHPDQETLESFLALEMTRLQRGFFILEIVISAAPLLGLLGTVTGLIQVFSNIPKSGNLPDSAGFMAGISLAMTTTMLGLIIAIPAIIAHSYFYRRLEKFAAKLQFYTSALLERSRRQANEATSNGPGHRRTQDGFQTKIDQ